MSIERLQCGVWEQSSFRRRKMSVSAPLHVACWLDMRICLLKLSWGHSLALEAGKCLFSSIESFSWFRHQKTSETWIWSAVSYHSFTSVCLSISFCWSVNHRGAISRSLSSTDGNQYLWWNLSKPICSCSSSYICLFAPIYGFLVFLLQSGLWGENISTDVFRCGVD